MTIVVIAANYALFDQDRPIIIPSVLSSVFLGPQCFWRICGLGVGTWAVTRFAQTDLLLETWTASVAPPIQPGRGRPSRYKSSPTKEMYAEQAAQARKD